ncbi:MAG: hypothetical protein AAF602_08385, partial [Myxococcota bacterium]
MIASILFTACSTAPTVTTETTFVGRLVDAGGAALPDVEINSIEGKYRTDGDGRFAVPVQPPSNLVHFVLDGVYYQRIRTDLDLDTAVEVMLPARQPRTLTCPPVDCDVALTWRFGAALSAKLIPECTPDAAVELGSVPTAPPRVSCRVGRGPGAVDHPMKIEAG